MRNSRPTHVYDDPHSVNDAAAFDWLSKQLVQ
jgi:hypothetical protein